METMNNQYQFSKTLRFGLTLKEYIKKNESHSTLKELINHSIASIEKTAHADIQKTEKETIAMINACVDLIHQHIKSWQKICFRSDQITLSKDYYKQLAKKACFDVYWLDKKERKQPQSQAIALNSLKKDDRNIKIIYYWQENIKKCNQLLNDFKIILNQYNTALMHEDKAHVKPHLTDFRKLLLSVFHLCNESLIPLTNGSISFSKLDKLDDSERNLAVKTFNEEEEKENRNELLYQIKIIKEYFEENGGNVPYGKATINYYTVDQKPHRFNDELKYILSNKINILSLIDKLIILSGEDIKEYFEFKNKNKLNEILNYRLSIIERAQFFKYKSIPASVRFLLADYLSRNHNMEKEKVLWVFNQIGNPQSLGAEYLKLKEDFDIYKYPLKLAFDYAWENVARNICNKKANAYPVQQCSDFLKTVFSVDSNHYALRLYGQLLYIKEKITTLEHEDNAPVDREKFKENIQTMFKQIQYRDFEKNYGKYKDAVLKWIEIDLEKQKVLKKENSCEYKAYDQAKSELGLLRGRQKNAIEKYKQLTETYKDIAVEFGRQFADLREKLREENEINKITHAGIILEDSNSDRYVLLTDLKKMLVEQVRKIFESQVKGELKTYQIKSLTPKTLEKLIKNKGGYKEFHSIPTNVDFKMIKRNWGEYKNNPDLLEYIKTCLTSSTMALQQHWSDFGLKLNTCNTYEEIERELEQKAYNLQSGSLSVSTVTEWVKNDLCILLPFVNQDITSKTRQLKNQFSKDWDMMFKEDNNYRLHPEFKISYRHPTRDYPPNKRYSRFQLIAHLLCEYFPSTTNYLNRKQQIKLFNNQDELVKEVKLFNAQQKPSSDFYVFGIDRGLKQLATLCVLNQKGEIQGGFEVYTRTFDKDAKVWHHTLLEERNVLDLSNLRVETTIEGKKVLVDLSKVELNSGKENQQKIKLKELAYIRKVQFQLQTLASDIQNERKGIENIDNDIRQMITPYKEGEHYANLPQERINNIIEKFKELVVNDDKYSKQELKELIELDAADDLKKGVVANMIGVVSFLLEKYHYQVYISIENLCRAFGFAKDGLNNNLLPSTLVDNDVDFKEQENLALAGLGTYHFFEMQLLKKLFRIQQDNKVIHLVPVFRSVDNYETIRKLSKKDGVEFTCKPFGIINFVDPKYTSKKCPVCDSTNVSRLSKQDDLILCKKCGFQTKWDSQNTLKNNELLVSYKKQNFNLQYIFNGDDNGAYHIALKTLKNLQ